MAMFLQESQKPVAEEALNIKSLSEAFEALHDIAVEHGNLTEALLQADYTVEKQSQALTEAGKVEEATAKVKGLAVKAGTAVKNFAAKVWARIKDIARLVARKVTEYVAKLKGAVSGSVCTGPANLSEYVNAVVRAAEKTLSHITSSATAGEADGKTEIPPLSGETKEYPLPVVQNLVSSVAGIASKLESVATKMLGEAGRQEATGGDAAAVSALRAKAAMGRACAAHVTSVTSRLGSVAASAKAKKGEKEAAAPAAAAA